MSQAERQKKRNEKRMRAMAEKAAERMRLRRIFTLTPIARAVKTLIR